MMETWRDSRVLYDGRIFRVREGEVVLQDGHIARREVVEHPGGVCALPFTGHSVILIRQFRIALGRAIIEVPAGKREGDEDPAHRAAVELEEETGYRAGRIVSAGSTFPTVGYCSEEIFFFFAFELEQCGQKLEHDERIELVEFSMQEVRDGLRNYTFDDGKTVIILERLLDYLEDHPELER